MAMTLDLSPLNNAVGQLAKSLAYALGRKDEAEMRFASATREHADFADAWNNLAQVRLEQGRLKEAADAIAQAVLIGGVRAESYRSLQAQVEQQRQAGP